MEIFEGYYIETFFKIIMSTLSGLVVFFGLHFPIFLKISVTIDDDLKCMGVWWFYGSAIFSFIIALMVFQGKLQITIQEALIVHCLIHGVFTISGDGLTQWRNRKAYHPLSGCGIQLRMSITMASSPTKTARDKCCGSGRLSWPLVLAAYASSLCVILRG